MRIMTTLVAVLAATMASPAFADDNPFENFLEHDVRDAAADFARDAGNTILENWDHKDRQRQDHRHHIERDRQEHRQHKDGQRQDHRHRIERDGMEHRQWRDRELTREDIRRRSDYRRAAIREGQQSPSRAVRAKDAEAARRRGGAPSRDSVRGERSKLLTEIKELRRENERLREENKRLRKSVKAHQEESGGHKTRRLKQRIRKLERLVEILKHKLERAKRR